LIGGLYYPTEDDCNNGTNGATWGCCLPGSGDDDCTPVSCEPVGFTSCEADVGPGWTETDTGVCQPIPAPGCPSGWFGVKHNCTTAYNTCEIQLDGVDNCGDPCGPETITCYQPPATEIECQRCSSSYKWSCANWMSGPDGQCGTGDDDYAGATYSCCCGTGCCPLKGYTSGTTGPCEDSSTTPPFDQFDGGQTEWNNCVRSCCDHDSCTDHSNFFSLSSCPYASCDSDTYTDEDCNEDITCYAPKCIDLSSGLYPDNSCVEVNPTDECKSNVYTWNGGSSSRRCYKKDCVPDKTSCPCGVGYFSDAQVPWGGSIDNDCDNGCGTEIDDECYCALPSAPNCEDRALALGEDPEDAAQLVRDNSSTGVGYFGFYNTFFSARNNCNFRNESDCWCTEECEPDACELKYSTVNVGFGTVSPPKRCTNICDDSNERNCYCFECDLDPCPANTREVGDVGDLILDKDQPYCENDCGEDRERFCRYECLHADCGDLLAGGYSDIDWLNDPPAGDYEQETFDIPIDGQNPGCDLIEPDVTCYYPNSDPEVDSITVEPSEPGNDVLLFTSNDHTGPELNNPVTVIATYSDTDDAEDIKAMYIWFSKPKSEPITKDFTTPIYYDENIDPSLGQTEDNSNFGLMFVRDGATWDVYIPHISGTSYWVKKDNDIQTTETVEILREIEAGVEKTMVTVHSIQVVKLDANRMQVSMNITFEDGVEANEELIDNGSYTIWGNVNDISGFDPLHDFDPYTLEEIRKPNNWVYQNNPTWSRTIWNLDMIDPYLADGAGSIQITVDDGQTILVNVEGNNAFDDMDLAVARLDACKEGGTVVKSLLVDNTTYYPNPLNSDEPLRLSCSDFSGDPIFIDMSNFFDSMLGSDADVGSSSDPKTLGGAPNPIEKTINLNGNEGGVITFYLTLMDNGGNYVQSHVNFKLGDWAVVEDGLVYGKGGTSSETRDLDNDDVWNGEDVLLSYVTKTEIPTNLDLSNQALLGNMEFTTALRELVHAGDNKAFKASQVQGTISNSIYSDLKDALESKSQGDDYDVYEIPAEAIGAGMTLTDIDGTPNCDKEYCILTQFIDETELTIGEGFQCNGKGLIIVEGNVTINPNFTNSSADSACIILASGDITITEGTNQGGTPGYDEIQAFLIAGDKIIINQETLLDESLRDGLIVEGGLVAIANGDELGGAGSIENYRNIHFSNLQLKPVIFVKARSKYAILGKALFGSQVDIFKTELGFKPY
jgi:hypothetical protein